MPSQDFQDRKALSKLPSSGWENAVQLRVGKATINRLEKNDLIETRFTMTGILQCKITQAGSEYRKQHVVKQPKGRVALTMVKPRIKIIDPTTTKRRK